MYTHVLLDFDHTLLDTEQSLRFAFDDAMAVTDHDTQKLDTASARPYDVFNEINQGLWRRVESGEFTPDQVHITRFERLVETLDLSAEPQAMADAFARGMGNNGDLYPGARQLLDTLSAAVSLAMVTNGLSAIQRARIKRLELESYFDAITISAEVGAAKPGTEIFDVTFAALGEPDRSTALMVGDSLSSDIAGGHNAGLDTCWYNPHGAVARQVDGNGPTYAVSQLPQITNLVIGSDC